MGQKQSSTKVAERVVGIGLILMFVFVGFKLASFIKSATFPSFETGDCLLQNPKTDLESWQAQNQDGYRVLATGERNYRLQWLMPEHMNGHEITLSFLYINGNYSKTQCPGKGGEQESER